MKAPFVHHAGVVAAPQSGLLRSFFYNTVTFQQQPYRLGGDSGALMAKATNTLLNRVVGMLDPIDKNKHGIGATQGNITLATPGNLECSALCLRREKNKSLSVSVRSNAGDVAEKSVQRSGCNAQDGAHLLRGYAFGGMIHQIPDRSGQVAMPRKTDIFVPPDAMLVKPRYVG
jgi:hypothetical protein